MQPEPPTAGAAQEGAPKARAQFPVPSAEPAPLPSPTVKEQKITVLRERLQIALDRRKVDKAAEILASLRAVIPDDRSLDEAQSRLLSLQEERDRAREKKSSQAPKQKEPSPAGREEREALKKKIAELIETANSFYQQEKYERGMQSIEEVLGLEPHNEEAARLREQIAKAQELASRIQQEDSRRKAEEAATAPPVAVHPQRSAPQRHDQDVWGSGPIPKGDVGYELPPEEKGPVGPPRQPLLYRTVERFSRIEIPVKPLIYAAIVIVALVGGYFIVESITNAVPPPEYSLLILPPSTIAGDSSFAYVADGFAEDLIRVMGEASELRVIDASTALGMRSSSLSTSQLARSVGANYYMQWSILRTAEGIVIQPSVFDTVSAKTLWVSRYQISKAELPALRNELVHRIVSAMKVTLSEEEQAAFRSLPTTSVTAYDLYLRGRAMLRQREAYPPEEPVRMLGLASDADSTFAEAQAALSWAQVLAYASSSEDSPSLIAGASRCVERAVVLGLRSAEVFRVWGIIEEFRSEYAKAVERLEQAVRISPSDAESQRQLAAAYVARGMQDAALRAARRAVSDDPSNVDSYTMLGQVLQVRGSYTEAFQAYEQGLRLARDRSRYASGFYADMLVYLKRFDAAVDILTDRIARAKQSEIDCYKLGRVAQSAGRPKPEVQTAFLRAKELIGSRLATSSDDAPVYSFLALVHTRLGEFKEAIAANTRAQQLAPNNVEVLYNTAKMYAIQMDKTRALDYLSKAIGQRYSLPEILDMDFHNLQTEPDFVSTVTR